MIPPFDEYGRLPPGIHWVEWAELYERYATTPYRQVLFSGMRQAIDALRTAGCRTVYIDGGYGNDSCETPPFQRPKS
jgi:hypothetical protein